MDQVGKFVVVGEDPAKKFGKVVKEFWATLTAKSQADGEIVCVVPANPEQMP